MYAPISKPMKAPTESMLDFSQVVFPVLGTFKYDGIRCLKVGGKALSSKFKPIPNDFTRNWIEANCPDGFDGELIVKGRTFHQLSGDIRRKEGEPNFTYHVFDWVARGLDEPYYLRCQQLQGLHEIPSRVSIELPIKLKTVAELEAFELKALSLGYEGIMIRSPGSRYKCGRATFKEALMFKVKRFEDAEAEIIEVLEQMHNENIAEKDAFGRTKRSKDAAGLVPAGTMGKLEVRGLNGKYKETIFEIGTGYDAATRQWFWDHRVDVEKAKLIVKFKHQPHGADERPRCPVYLGIRDKWDL